MRPNTTTLILSASLIVVAGMFVASLTGLISHETKVNTLGGNALFTGHVETIVRDADGNIKEYRQSDNVVTNTGETCAARYLFNRENIGGTVSNATAICRGALTGSFTVIGLGSGGATAANGTQRSLTSEFVGISGLTRSDITSKTVTFTNATNPGQAEDTGAKVEIQGTFTNNSGSSQSVSESGLFNSTSGATSGMFARQTFSTINVGNGDSLTVKWTINIGATSKFIS